MPKLSIWWQKHKQMRRLDQGREGKSWAHWLIVFGVRANLSPQGKAADEGDVKQWSMGAPHPNQNSVNWSATPSLGLGCIITSLTPSRGGQVLKDKHHAYIGFPRQTGKARLVALAGHVAQGISGRARKLWKTTQMSTKSLNNMSI